MRYLSKFILSIMMLLMPFSLFAAEESVPGLTDYSGTWWLNAGFGAGYVFSDDDNLGDDDDNSGPAATFSFNYAVTDNQVLTLRTSAVDVDFLDIFGASDAQVDNVYDFGVLYGLMHKSDLFLASIAGGLAYTAVEYNHNADFYDDDQSHNYTESTIGVPLEAQLFWTPSSFLGLGLIGLANINSEASYVAGLVAIQVGDLK